MGGPKEMGTEKATKAPEGTAAGVTTGGVIGGTLGVLAGIGLLAISGLGPFIAAGPITAGLAGLGVGGAVGGVTGALVGMGIPEFEAKRYEGRLQKGGILLSVHCSSSDEVKRAKEIVERSGAKDVSSNWRSFEGYRKENRCSLKTESFPTIRLAVDPPLFRGWV
jgi:hypothetical protein